MDGLRPEFWVGGTYVCFTGGGGWDFSGSLLVVGEVVVVVPLGSAFRSFLGSSSKVLVGRRRALPRWRAPFAKDVDSSSSRL